MVAILAQREAYTPLPPIFRQSLDSYRFKSGLAMQSLPLTGLIGKRSKIKSYKQDGVAAFLYLSVLSLANRGKSIGAF
jgi:hypothetical protein